MSQWKYAMSDSGNRALIADKDGETVVSVSNRTHDSRFESRVRLFTAAPDLLCALENAVSFIKDGKELPADLLADCEIAIAKAQANDDPMDDVNYVGHPMHY